MGKFAEDVCNLHRGRGATRTHNRGGAWRTYECISPNAGLSLLVVVEHAEHEADDHKHERHLDRNRKDADQRPNGPVHQVRDDHLIHAGIVIGSISCDAPYLRGSFQHAGLEASLGQAHFQFLSRHNARRVDDRPARLVENNRITALEDFER